MEETAVLKVYLSMNQSREVFVALMEAERGAEYSRAN